MRMCHCLLLAVITNNSLLCCFYRLGNAARARGNRKETGHAASPERADRRRPHAAAAPLDPFRAPCATPQTQTDYLMRCHATWLVHRVAHVTNISAIEQRPMPPRIAGNTISNMGIAQRLPDDAPTATS